jgi:hypothetical protein
MPAPALALLAALSFAPPATVAVEPLPFDPAAWKSLPRTTLRLKEDGKDVTYAGVPLCVVLEAKLKGRPEMAAWRSLADAVLLVRAADDYQAAVSAVAVAMDPKGERHLLALERDGKPLDAGQGPVKLVIPGDPAHVRWVRMVSGIDLVRLPKPKPAVKAEGSRGR